MWSKEKIKDHLIACELLDKIKDLAFDFIKNHPNTTEYEVQQFILEEFKKNNIIAVKPHNFPIVAFNANSSSPHHFPKKDSKKLSENTLILIDIWARQRKKNAPFSDITWMAYYGNEIPEEINAVWKIVRDARDFGVKFIENELKQGRFPTGKEVDDIARKIISDAGYKDNILHTTGHSIGFNSPHGTQLGISQKNNSAIVKNLGYTIEPGIYLKDKFGIRSEIDFYINDDSKVVITTPIQKELIKIIPNNSMIKNK
jgi:Xaa-Pro dipeptidase